MRHRQRIVAAVIGCGGLASLLVALWLQRDALLDSWHISRVERAGHDATVEMVDALAARKSLRAARRFLAAMEAHECCLAGEPGCLRNVLDRLADALGDEAIPLVAEALGDPERERTWWANERIEKAIESGRPPAPWVGLLLRRMSDPDASVRADAAGVAGEIERLPAGEPTAGRDLFDALVRLLADPDPEVRENAVWALAQPPRAVEALPRLRTLEKDPEGSVRAAAHRFVALIAWDHCDPRSKDVARDAFIEAWRDPDPRVRQTAVEILVELEGVGAPQVPFLLLAARDRDQGVQVAAREALTAADREAAAAAVEALRADDAATRRRLEHVFVRAASAYAPCFVKMLDDPEEEAREWAARVLSSLLGPSASGPDTAGSGPGIPRQAVERLLRHTDPEIRLGALSLAGWFEASEAEQLLRGALSDASAHVRVKAAGLLRDALRHPPDSPLRNRWPRVPVPLAPETISALEGLLGDPEPLPRIASAATLIGRDLGGLRATEALAAGALAAEIQGARTWVRISALREAVRLGPRAAAIQDVLEAAAQDPHPEVRELAAQALEAARPQG